MGQGGKMDGTSNEIRKNGIMRGKEQPWKKQSLKQKMKWFCWESGCKKNARGERKRS